MCFVILGESTWNNENRFTGWTDVPLSITGKAEALSAGQVLKDKGYKFDIAFTSVLKRAIHTCWSVLKVSEQSHVPIINCWRLNERHYGALQGLNKSETAAKHGEEQVKIWRRAYAVAPPAVDKNDSRWPGNDPIYKGLVPIDALPLTECLKDTVDRGKLILLVLLLVLYTIPNTDACTSLCNRLQKRN